MRIRSIFILVTMSCSLVFFISSCSSKKKKENAPAATDDASEQQDDATNDGTTGNDPNGEAMDDTQMEANAIPAERRLRTGNEYLASVSRLFNLKQSDFQEYDNVKHNLPLENSVSSLSVHESLWTATTVIASEGCEKYLNDSSAGQNQTPDEVLDSLAGSIYGSGDQLGTISQQANSLAAMTDNEYQKKMVICSLIAASLIYY